MSRPAAAPLPAEETTRLTDFARACKAAARVVALYPATHPAIQSSLGRIAESAGGLFARGPARLTVLPDGLLLNDQAPGRSDSAVQELAAMLHGHLIGEMTLVGEMGPAAWHTFLGLLARSPEDIRSRGGIVRAWMAAGGGPIELRQIDYGDVLRERKGALAGDWDEIVTSYLEGEFSDLDDQAMAALLDIAGDTLLTRNDGLQFDQHLVRRFSQLMGIYPPGNMVRLDTGEIAVVLRIYAPDPGRPRVRVVVGADGAKLARPRDVNLWESTETSPGPKAILSPVDPGPLGIDPLTYL